MESDDSDGEFEDDDDEDDEDEEDEEDEEEEPDPDEVIEKAKKCARPDRKKKLQEKRFNDETVVKCCLGTLLRGPTNIDPRPLTNYDMTSNNSVVKVRKAIDQLVDSFSKRMVLGSLNLNKLLQELFDGVPTMELMDVKVPDFTATMMGQLMTGLKGCSKIDPAIQSFFDRNPLLLNKVQDNDIIPRYNYDKNIYVSGAKQFLVNFNNYYWMNLDKWINKFIYSGTVKARVARLLKKDEELDEKAVFRCLQYDIHSWPMDKPMKALLDKIKLLSPWITKNLEFQHKLLGNKNMTDNWLKKLKASKPKMIRYCVYINRLLKYENSIEQPINKKTGELIPPKKIPLSPISKIKSHFITICTMGLYCIMRGTKMIDKKKCTWTTFKGIAQDQWPSLLKIDDILGKGKRFTGTVNTDGVAINVHFSRRKSKIELARLKIESDKKIKVNKKAQNIKDWKIEHPKGKIKRKTKVKNDKTSTPKVDPKEWNIIGCDPGRTFIFYMVREKEGGGHDVFKLSRRQYYNESGVFTSRINTERWLSEDSIKAANVELTTVSSKGDSLVDFNAYLGVVFKHWDTIWKEMTKKKWANQRFRLYGGKKRAFTNFFSRLEVPNKKTCIVYGSAKFAPGGKGEMSVPTSRAFKECKNRFPKTIVESEFRSTRIFNGDKTSILLAVESIKTGKKVRGLLWYQSTIKNKSKYVNRDLNAAINILHCYTLPTRPPMLCTGQEALPKIEVGKKIIC